MSTENTGYTSPMPRMTIGVGGVLIVLGVVAYIATAFASWTALIPAILGAVLLISGLIALKNTTVGVHIGLVVALLGLLGTAMNVIELPAVFTGDAERPMAVVVSTISFLLLLIYLIVGIRSFIRARRWTDQ